MSAVRSSARRAGQPLPRRRPGEVGDDVHRVGGRAAVAERQQPPAGVEGGAQVAPRAAQQRLEAVVERLLAQRADLVGLHRRRGARRRRGPRRGRAPARPGTDRGSSTRRRRARAARCGPRAARGARRTRARAPRARGRASRPAPGARTGRRSAARAPTRRRAARRRPSGSRARARAPAPRRARPVAGLAEGDHDVVGLGDRGRARRRAGRTRRSARWPAARACPRSPGARTRRRRGARPSAPAPSRPTATSRPSRAKRSAMRWHSRAIRAPPRRRRAPRWPRGALGQPALDALAHGAGRGRGGHTAAPERAATSSDSHVRQRVDALAGARADEHRARRRGARRRGCAGSARGRPRGAACRSSLLTSTRSQVRNMSGYFSGLSSPSVTEETITRASSPTWNSAGHTRLPTFSMMSRSMSCSGSAGSARAHHVGVEVALAAEARVGVELGHRDVQAGQPVGVHRALHVALEHADADAVDPVGEQRLEQRGLARPRRAHQVDDGDAVGVEVGAVGAGDRVVGVQRVLDDPDLHAVHAGSCSSTSIDSTRNSSPLTTLASAAPQAEQRKSIAVELPLVAAAAAQARRDDLLLQARALAHRAARDVLEVELQRRGHDLAQVADLQVDRGHAPPGGVALDGVDDGAGEGELVHGSALSRGRDVGPSVAIVDRRGRRRGRPRR